MHALLETSMSVHAHMVHAFDHQTRVEIVRNPYWHETIDNEN